MSASRSLRIVAIAAALALAGAVFACLAARPEPPPDGSESARRLAGGPYGVGRVEVRWVDRDRPTPANGAYPGAPERSFETSVWFPEATRKPAPRRHPLVVYSHGFMSFRGDGSYLARQLASRGYVVVAADSPLSNLAAPGGPTLDDLASHPADVAFLIDRALGWPESERPFPGQPDPDRVGVAGLSLGGLTSTLVAFHPRMRDPRIAAAVSIAGPVSIFSSDFFATSDVPFLMIAGTADAMVDFETHARGVPRKVMSGGLVEIDGGSHTGFSAQSAGLLRLLRNPDRLGCGALRRSLGRGTGGSPFEALGGPEDGVLPLPEDDPRPCERPLEPAMNPGRQHMITALAVVAFFESHFAPDATTRRANADYLARSLGGDFPEVRYRGAAADAARPGGSRLAPVPEGSSPSRSTRVGTTSSAGRTPRSAPAQRAPASDEPSPAAM